MDIPPDFPPVHSCNHYNQLIVDPHPGRLFDRKNRYRKWAAFDPELTVRDLREQQRHRCAFSEYAKIEDKDDDAPVLYSFKLSPVSVPGFQSIEFGIPGLDTESGSDTNGIEFGPDEIVVKKRWTLDLLAIPGIIPPY
jgi:hypothetical protein